MFRARASSSSLPPNIKFCPKEIVYMGGHKDELHMKGAMVFNKSMERSIFQKFKAKR